MSYREKMLYGIRKMVRIKEMFKFGGLSNVKLFMKVCKEIFTAPSKSFEQRRDWSNREATVLFTAIIQ